jgi:Flagellar hook-length control protein FliK
LTPVGAHPAGTEAAAPPHVDPAASPTALATPAAGAAPAPAASPYDRIDQGDSPVVLHTDAQHVAVGIRDPQLGWVEIKTQNTAGHVDATLVASSSQTHDALAAQLPAMAQYLEQRDVRVGTLAVHHPILQSNTGGGQSGGFSSGAGSGGGGAQHFNQSGSGHQDAAERFPGVSSGLLHSPSSSRAVSVEDSGSSLRPVSYISVRA